MPAALLARFSRLDLLSGGARDLPARQHTFRATLDWSYHLLTAAEPQLLARLAVFVGGWTLAAAEAICTGADEVGLVVLDDLQSLLDKSLVWQEPHADDVLRFRLLEPIRDGAVERLEASGEAAAQHHRHAAFYPGSGRGGRAAVDRAGAGALAGSPRGGAEQPTRGAHVELGSRREPGAGGAGRSRHCGASGITVATSPSGTAGC